MRPLISLDEPEQQSKAGSLEEIHALGRDSLQKFLDLAERGDLRTDQPSARGIGVDPQEQREGATRTGTKEYLNFLGVAGESLAEMETKLAHRLGYLDSAALETILISSAVISRMLSVLVKLLRSNLT